MSGRRSKGLLRRAYPGLGALREHFPELPLTFAIRVRGPRELVTFADLCTSYRVQRRSDPAPQSSLLVAGDEEVVFSMRQLENGCHTPTWIPAFAEVSDPRLAPLLRSVAAR